MATGLNLDSGFAELANPYSLSRPSGDGISEMAQGVISRIPQPQAQPVAAPQDESKFWTNQQTGEFYVNGVTFAQDDDTKILQVEELFDRPSVGRPQGEGWMPVTEGTYGQIADKIRNPSLGRLFAKNFGIGVDQLQQLAGSALQLAGFEETGGRIVEQQEKDLAKTSVYQREFTDIESGGDVVDWFVANLGQQGPMLLESIAAAGLGAAVGTATGGPGLGTAGGTIAGFFGKNALKKKIQEAAKNYTAAKAKGAKPSRADVKTLKDAAGYAGAAGGAFLSNYALGTGDIYGEMREQGVDPDDTAARMQALMGAFPYAAADTLGEYVLASRLFGGALQPRPLTAGATRTRRGGELLRRGLTGGAVGAGVEGTTELGQEALVMGLSGQDLTSDEAVKRFINSFAAGAAVGGAIGGAANLRRGGAEETNLLDSSGSATAGPKVAGPRAQGVLPLEGGEGGAPSPVSEPAVTDLVETPPPQFAPFGIDQQDDRTRLQNQQQQIQSFITNANQELQDMASGARPLNTLRIQALQRQIEQARQSLATIEQQLSTTRAQGITPPPPGQLALFQPSSTPVLQRGRFPEGQAQGQLSLVSGSGVVGPRPMGAPAVSEPVLNQQEDRARLENRQREQLQNRQRELYELIASDDEEKDVDALQAELSDVRKQLIDLPPIFDVDQQTDRARLENEQRQLDALNDRLAEELTSTQDKLRKQQIKAQQKQVREALARVNKQIKQLPVAADTARAPGQRALLTPVTGKPTVGALRSAGERVPTRAPAVGPNVDKKKLSAARKRVNLLNGVERINYNNEDVYEGQLKNGVPSGEGIYYFANGDVIVGKFKAGEVTSGTYNFSDGSTYVGSFRGGAFTSGTYNFSDGSTYVGSFRGGAFDGQGVFTDVNGSVADGMFKDGAFVPPEPPPVAKKPAPKKETKAPAPKGEMLKKGKKETAPTAKLDTTQEEIRQAELDATEAANKKKYDARRKQIEAEEKRTGAYLSDVGVDNENASPLQEGQSGYWERMLASQDSAYQMRKEEFKETKPKKGETLKKGKKDAVQEPSATQVSTRQQSKAGAKVGEGVPVTGKAPTKGEALKTQTKKRTQKKDDVTEIVEQVTAEEMWEDMKPIGAPKFDKLDPSIRILWRKEMDAGRASIVRAKEIYDGALTPKQQLENAISNIDTATTTEDFVSAIENVVTYAFFPTDLSGKIKEDIQARANQALQDLMSSDPITQGYVDRALMDMVSLQSNIYATDRTTGENSPWFNYAVERGLVDRIKLLTTVKNLPEQYKETTKISPRNDESVDTDSAEVKAEKATLKATNKLIDIIVDLRSGVKRLTNKPQVATLTKEMKATFAKADPDFPLADGSVLGDYFNEAGEPKIIKTIDGYKVVTEELLLEDQRALERETKAARDEAKIETDDQLKQLTEQYSGKNDTAWDDDSDGMYFRGDGEPILNPIGIGRLKMLSKVFLSKLKSKPKLHVFSNQAEMRAQNPELYKRAAAARKQGDFDTTVAAGYSFGDTIILFSDNIRTEAQVKFIIAHETLGHFGFKGIMSPAEFKTALDRIYNTDRNVRAGVEQKMEVQGMEKYEAIEEYLADNAAILDSSLVQRIWYALKDALNRLGFEFQDDEARYLVGQARKYVRNGSPGNFVSGQSLGAAIRNAWVNNYDGRFSEAAADTGPRMWAAAADANAYSFNQPLNQVDRLFSDLKARGIDVRAWTAKLLEQFQSFNNIARRSSGAKFVYDTIMRQANQQKTLARKYNDMTRMLHSTDLGKQERDQVSDMLAYGALLKSKEFNDSPELMKKFGRLVIRNDDGTISQENLVKIRAELEAAGSVSREKFGKGFQIMLSNGQVQTFKMAVAEDSAVWKAYTQMREAMNEATIDMMLANYEASYYESNNTVDLMRKSKLLKDMFREQDIESVRSVAKLYQNIRYANENLKEGILYLNDTAVERGEEFLKRFADAVDNDNAFNDFVNKVGVAEQFKNEQFYDDAVKVLKRMRDGGAKKDNHGYAVQKVIRELFVNDFQTRNAENFAKRSILKSYVPFKRYGDIQVRLVAMVDGKPAKLSEKMEGSIPFYKFESAADSQPTMDMLEDLYLTVRDDNGIVQKGEVKKWNLEDVEGKDVEVTFKVERKVARAAPDLVEATNFNEFVYVLNRLNIDLKPAERQRILLRMTAQDNAARKNLERTNTPGWNKDMIRTASEHLETISYSAAKKIYRNRLGDVLLQERMWQGDRQRLDALKAAVDGAQTDDERQQAQTEYEAYAYEYIYSAPEGEVVDGRKTLGRGNKYKDDAIKLIRFRDENPNVVINAEDLLSTDIGSKLKLWTVVMQLGGSIASGLLNLISVITNTIPYLATRNSKTAFGGGFGFAKTMASVANAMSDMGSYKLSDAVYLRQVLADLKAGKQAHGLTVDEAQFLLDSTTDGLLDAAQTIALLGTARGKVTNPRVQQFIDIYMTPFNYTEQLNRRATALASYRMERDRSVAQGDSLARASERAKTFARDAVNTTQGNYDAYNRPVIGRGNITQYIMMYKMYPIMSVQLLKNMDYKGKGFMLGMLFLMSGLKGLPFAEDLFDVYDTIAQKLGFTRASAEKMFIDGIESIAPGMTPIIMRGILDQSGLSMSTRIGLGNMFPATSAGKAGADTWRQFEEFIGPMYSAMSGLIGTAGSIGQYGAEAIGLRNGETTLLGIMRDAPASAVRAIADGLTYMDDGRVTNNRGYVVSDNVATHVLLGRFLGFYPASASMQNDIVRLQKETADYAKAVKAEYVGSAVKAVLAGDNEAIARIEGYVREWNESAKGSGLEITKFSQSYRRAAREARRPTLERYLRSAPKGLRDETNKLGEIFGVNF
jgi:hypothetical protein